MNTNVMTDEELKREDLKLRKIEVGLELLKELHRMETNDEVYLRNLKGLLDLYNKVQVNF